VASTRNAWSIRNTQLARKCLLLCSPRVDGFNHGRNMTRKIKIALAAALIAAFASPAFAHNEWFVDGGRYLNGQIVSYA
jgi:hypothetical protein